LDWGKQSEMRRRNQTQPCFGKAKAGSLKGKLDLL
jgi:hypothetical protein